MNPEPELGQELENRGAIRGLLTRLNRWLFAPRKSVEEVETRRQASLLAAFLFVLAILTWLGVIIPTQAGLVNMFTDPFAVIMFGTAMLLTLAYAISRTRFYRIAAGITVSILSALPYALALSRSDFSPERLPSVLGWLILPLLLGSIFLNFWGVFLLAAVNLTALVLFPVLIPEISVALVAAPLSLLSVVATLVLVSVRNRDYLERLRLVDFSTKNDELERIRNSLEGQVEQRTKDLERRILQLRTAAEISRSLGAVIEPDDLYNRVVQQIKNGFNLYYVGLFLLDEGGGYATLKAGTGSAGQKMLRDKHRLAIGGSSMIGWATANKDTRIALDVGRDAVHFNNPHLPYTRSEMALPIMLGHQMLGALTIQSNEPQAFDEDDVIVLKGIADSLAAAIYNGRLFSQLQASLEEIRTLHESYLSEAWSGRRMPSRDFEFQTGDLQTPEAGEQLSALQVPLTLREQVIGQLTLESKKSDWSEEETAFIEAVATQAAVALENARLLEETKQRVEREKIVSDIANKIWGTTDIDTILRTSIRELGRMMNATEAIIQLEVHD